MNKNKKTKNTNELISEMKLMLNDKPSLTLESLVFSETDEPGYDVDIDGFEEEPQSDKVGNEDGMDEPQPSSNGVEAQVKPIVDQIRKLALQGITMLAEHPETESYDFCKKIWQLCDKTVESKKIDKTEKI